MTYTQYIQTMPEGSEADVKPPSPLANQITRAISALLKEMGDKQKR